MSKNYNSDSIETLAFPDNIRKNPAMYIGGVDAYGLFVVLRELLDNAADEYLAGRNKSVGCFIDKDGSYWVQDSGSGIPQGTKNHEVTVNGKKVINKIPTMQAVFGVMHTSGKFRSDAYAVSVGTHGVGAKGTNATADFFEVYTCYKEQWFSIKFKKGILTQEVKKTKPPVSPITGKTMTRGTLVHFKPDVSIFSVKTFPPSMLVEWAEIMAYLNPGFQIVLKVKDKTKAFLSKEGPKEYIKDRLEKLKAESETDMFEFNSDLATAVVAFSNVDGFELKGFTNGLANSQGGRHVDSVANALYKAVQEYKGAKQEFSSADFRDGLIGIVNAKLHKAQFSSQDKAKLTDERMGKDFEASLIEEAKKFFKGNKAMAKRLCDRAAKINDLKTKFKASKAVATELNKVKKQGLPPNYAPAHKSVPVNQRELILVEGASAAGPLRQVRTPNQAILPLKGKILNTMRSKGDRALLSRDILNILSAIGFDPKVEDPLKKLKIGRIVCLADPDPDGPLVGSTRVMLCDGTRPTIKQLATRFGKDQTPFWVWSTDKNGKLVPAQATLPMEVATKTKLVEITTDDGSKFRCSLNHKWPVNAAAGDPAEFRNGVPYLRADQLTVGDSLRSIYFGKTAPRVTLKGNEKKGYYTWTNPTTGKKQLVHQRVMEVLKPKEFRNYKRANSGVTGGAIHIHHGNTNSLDNTPTNLEFLSKVEHYSEHGAQMSSEYNGSAKQKANLTKYWEGNTLAREVAAAQLVRFNKSERHRAATASMNTDPDQKAKQAFGRIARVYLAFKNLGLAFNRKNWNDYAAVLKPSWSYIKANGITASDIDEYIKARSLTSSDAAVIVHVDDKPKMEYPKQCLSKFYAFCKRVQLETGLLSEESYTEMHTALMSTQQIARGTPTWARGLSDHGSLKTLPKVVKEYNHTITKIRHLEVDPTPVYCLSVPGHQNFLIEDVNGNGVATGNSHINCLLLTLFRRYLPGMFEEGMVYVANAPEFYAITKDALFTGPTLSSVAKKLEDAKVKADVHHVKGWGEVDAQIVKFWAVDPATRQLLKIKPLTTKDTNVFDPLMGGAADIAETEAK